MQFVTRDQWGAQPPKAQLSDMPTARGVKVHWIGGPYQTPADHAQCAAEVRAIQQEHLSDPVQHWIDIAYNLVVCGHSVVFEGRGAGKESGANGNQPLNLAHYAVCAIQGTNEPLTDALKSGLRDAIEYLQANGAGGEILGHRDGYSTDCPGDELYAWVHAGAPRPGGGSPSPAPAPQPAPAPHLTAPPFPGELLEVEQPMLHDDNVRRWQQRMADRGWPITVDGWYGGQSATICRQFQEDSTAHGWPLTVDGVVGPQTWRASWERPVS
ncbi:N-acetylmuramoyl-L-alanine amidase [Streptomyces tateyamensis]|uniref:N-acetylmuramoyl-L-alanine amidase n=1 Tax=Streptomyces tateyamensis TaxID=565073 RepID=A0A2V4NGX5_9ACTN|nr:N-acetylmuramoyl-L-alanine amidase [Streptomyces tateyamensis]PYC83463.1 N-acetylmuramoyl-L-alanine amidase [Streptomyces tateyamensis]